MSSVGFLCGVLMFNSWLDMGCFVLSLSDCRGITTLSLCALRSDAVYLQRFLLNFVRRVRPAVRSSVSVKTTNVAQQVLPVFAVRWKFVIFESFHVLPDRVTLVSSM